MINPSQHATTLLLYGIVIHLFCDWILQNRLMSENKSNLLHPAAFTHAYIHFVGMSFLFPWYAALLIAITHLLIDTRVPLAWWRGFFGQTQDDTHVQIWSDQVLHITILAIVALVIG